MHIIRQTGIGGTAYYCYISPCHMFYVHNNQLPRVKTAQVESVYGLIKAEGRVDLL